MTPLAKTLKRALRIDGRDYVVTLRHHPALTTRQALTVGVSRSYEPLSQIAGTGRRAFRQWPAKYAFESIV
jgi:hypothetical protein